MKFLKKKSPKPKGLVYAAYTRCPCGAGMAYPKNGKYPDEDLSARWPHGGYWDCSAILLGTAVENGQPGSVKHEAKLPFAFYEIKSENQPSVRGATTRPRIEQIREGIERGIRDGS